MHPYRGRFLWYELHTTDLEAAKLFYSKVIGWNTSVFKGEMGSYDMFAVGDRGVAGAMTLPKETKGAPPHWLTYLGTPEVDRDTERVKGLGGKVLVPPMDIPTVGRFAVV